MTIETEGLQIRDRRNRGWFWIGNEILDKFGEYIKGHGIAVYCELVRHADQEGHAWPSLRHIALHAGVSRPTATETLETLAYFGLIHIEKRHSAAGDATSNLYTLLEPPADPAQYVLGVVNQVDHVVNQTYHGGKAGLPEQDTINKTELNKTHFTLPEASNEKADATQEATTTAANDPGLPRGNHQVDHRDGVTKDTASTPGEPGPAAKPRLSAIEIGQLLDRSAAAGRSDGEDDDVDPEKGRPKWSIPDDDFQRDFLERLAVRPKFFQQGEKRSVKAIHNALRAGDIAGANVYLKCIEQLKGKPANPVKLSDMVLPLPRTWYEFKMAQAGEHPWTVSQTLRYLLNRDQIIEHCNYQLRQKAPSKGETREGTTETRDYSQDLSTAATLKRLSELAGQ